MRGKLRYHGAGHRAVFAPLPSMRPALYARETAPQKLSSGVIRSTSSFKEARALCAGNSERMPLLDTGLFAPLPSMRPALYARETGENVLVDR